MDIYRVDKKKRAEIREEVATSLGPPDPTVLVQEKEERVCVSIPQLLETFRKFGDVVLVRVTDDAILVTFKKSTSAVTATSVKEVCQSVGSTPFLRLHPSFQQLHFLPICVYIVNVYTWQHNVNFSKEVFV